MKISCEECRSESLVNEYSEDGFEHWVHCTNCGFDFYLVVKPRKQEKEASK